MSIKSSKSLVENARRIVNALSYYDALKQHSKNNVIFVDVRDVRELEKTGKISRAKHVPRGMLEFWIDPESPYFKSYFNEKSTYVFYCASGWRSALAAKTALEMGLTKVFHLNNGINEWISLGGPLEKVLRKINKD